MSVGIAMLVHDPVERSAQVARHFVNAGAKVALHLDRRFSKRRGWLADHAGADVISRYRCPWGSFNLVAATRDLVRHLLERDPSLSHVVLLSGTCLPLWTPERLMQFCADHRDTDFIDMHRVEDGAWVRDGLTVERFSLYHPFSYRHQRRLFEASVALQRRIGVSRSVPSGLIPHFGSQWWALSRPTLQRILADPMGPKIDRFFSRAFIPDESYFQTMTARHGTGPRAPSLTVSRFDDQGRPFTFYDDHQDLLASSGAAFARKIWPGADGLYRHFLVAPEPAPPTPVLAEYLDQVLKARVAAPSGLRSAGCMPTHQRMETPAPYLVVAGAGPDLAQTRDVLRGLVDGHVHGQVFGPEGAQLAWPGPHAPGNLSTQPALRDAMGLHYLPSLMRMAPGRHVIFVEAQDPAPIQAALLADPNAVIVTGPAWPSAPNALPTPEAWRARLCAPPLSWPLSGREAQVYG